jgi:hypothetical protein
MLPKGGRLIPLMLDAVLLAKAMSKDEARTKWGQAILERAQAAHDAEIYNAAAHLYLGTDRLAEIDQLAWDDTADPRFAASLLVGAAEKGTLTLDDPRLKRAVAQFPEDAVIARLVVQMTAQAKKPLAGVLVQGIKAEYSHFSAGGMFPRPSAAMLRVYFKKLSEELAAAK